MSILNGIMTIFGQKLMSVFDKDVDMWVDSTTPPSVLLPLGGGVLFPDGSREQRSEKSFVACENLCFDCYHSDACSDYISSRMLRYLSSERDDGESLVKVVLCSI